MAETTHIEWADATWNIITGCQVVSPGCTNCYAMRLAGTRLKHHPTRQGLTIDTKAGPVWNGEIRFNDHWLTQPLEWKTPKSIFVCAHGDLFADGVTDAMLDKVFQVMSMASHHTFLVLTKRPRRMREYLESRLDGDPFAEAADHIADLLEMTDHPVVLEPNHMPLPNVWGGVSCEDQRRADERIGELLSTPLAKRFVSLEPLLGPISMRGLDGAHDDDEDVRIDALRGGYSVSKYQEELAPCAKLDWVIVGGESGKDARPMHPDWARSLRDQCVAAGVPFHFKQHGAWVEAPWKVHRRPGETDDALKMRAEAEGASHALTSCGILNAFSHKPWSAERADHATPDMIGLRLVGKKAAGRVLDGRTWDERPELGR